jgi:outer membrane protein
MGSGFLVQGTEFFNNVFVVYAWKRASGGSVMLRKTAILTTAIIVFVALFAGSGMAASMLKVAIVDLQGALNATSEGLAAKETLRKKHMAKQEQIDKMKAEIDSMEEKSKSPVLSEEAQADLKEDIRRRKAQLIEFVTLAKEEENRENQRASSRILDGLVKIAQEIAKEENYSIVFEKSGSGVVYFEDSMDITDTVVKIYNERYQAGEGQ